MLHTIELPSFIYRAAVQKVILAARVIAGSIRRQKNLWI